MCCKAKQGNRERNKKTGTLAYILQSLSGVQFFLLIPLHGLEVKGLAEESRGPLFNSDGGFRELPMSQEDEYPVKEEGEARWRFLSPLAPSTPLTEIEQQCSTEHSFAVPVSEGKGFCNAVPRAPSQQVRFLASHPKAQDYFTWVLFCFIPRSFIVKYMNGPGRPPHTQLRSLTMGQLCKIQGIPTWEKMSHKH